MENHTVESREAIFQLRTMAERGVQVNKKILLIVSLTLKKVLSR